MVFMTAECGEDVVAVFVGLDATAVEVERLPTLLQSPTQCCDMSLNGPSPFTLRLMPVLSTIAPMLAPL